MAMDRWNLPERMAGAMDIPADAALGLPRIELVGRRCLCVYCHRGLLEYGEACIRVAARGTEIRISGHALHVCSIDAGALRVEGCISCVELLDGCGEVRRGGV